MDALTFLVALSVIIAGIAWGYVGAMRRASAPKERNDQGVTGYRRARK